MYTRPSVTPCFAHDASLFSVMVIVIVIDTVIIATVIIAVITLQGPQKGSWHQHTVSIVAIHRRYSPEFAPIGYLKLTRSLSFQCFSV